MIALSLVAFRRKDSILVVDGGYAEFGLFGRWIENGIFFMTQQNENVPFTTRFCQNPLPFSACGAMCGGAITSVLINIPGVSASLFQCKTKER
jgi:hypothetical protein